LQVFIIFYQEEQKAASKEVVQEYESSDEEAGNLDIGGGEIKDIKEVQKQKKLAQNAQRESDFKWDDMGTINKGQQ
jgi:hypothetical protein